MSHDETLINIGRLFGFNSLFRRLRGPVRRWSLNDVWLVMRNEMPNGTKKVCGHLSRSDRWMDNRGRPKLLIAMIYPKDM